MLNSYRLIDYVNMDRLDYLGKNLEIIVIIFNVPKSHTIIIYFIGATKNFSHPFFSQQFNNNTHFLLLTKTEPNS